MQFIIQPWKFNQLYGLRSKVNSIQLVSLIPSRVWKEYGNKMCFDRLIQDLICLEKDGIEVFKPRNKTVYAGLPYIISDNLGQHLV